MNTRIPLALLALALVLAGCSGAAEPARAAVEPEPSPYAAVARGVVTVRGGLLSVVSPIDGRVTQVAVHEGDQVQAGQSLARLDDTLARADLEMAQAELRQARTKEAMLTSQQHAAQKQARRETAAARAGAGAGQSADTANARAAELGARRDAAKAAVAEAEAKLETERYRLEEHDLRAPFAAEVVHVQTQAGAMVSTGSGTLFVLLPDRPHIVRAELNADYVDAVHAGMRASVILEDADTKASWPAKVARVGRILEPSSLDEDPTTRVTDRIVECILDFDKPTPLRIGRRVLVRFLPDPGSRR